MGYSVSRLRWRCGAAGSIAMLPSPIMRMSCLRRLTNSLISNTPSPSLSMDRIAVGARPAQEAQLLIYKKYRHAHVLDALGVGGLVVVAARGGGEIEPRDLGHVLHHLVDVTRQLVPTLFAAEREAPHKSLTPL